MIGFAVAVRPLPLPQSATQQPDTPRSAATSYGCARNRSSSGAGICRRRAPLVSAGPRDDDRKDNEWDAERLGFTLVGTLIGVHGVRGEAKLWSDSDFAKERLSPAAGPSKRRPKQHYLRLPKRNYPRPVNLTMSKKASQKNTWVVKLQPCSSPEDVKQIRGAQLYVRDDDRPGGMSRRDFLVADLVGLKVVALDREDCVLGHVSGVITQDELPGGGKLANDVLEVTLTPDDRDDSDDPERALVPFVTQIVPFVDLDKKILHLDPPSGLLEATRVPKVKERGGPRGLLMPAAGTMELNMSSTGLFP